MLFGVGFMRHNEVYTDMNTFASNSNNISWSATATRALNVVTIVCSIAHLVSFIVMPELFDAQFARVGFCATDQGWLHTMEYVALLFGLHMHTRLVSGLVWLDFSCCAFQNVTETFAIDDSVVNSALGWLHTMEFVAHFTAVSQTTTLVL